ncbi:MAG: cellulose binding domain-containing protein, partial [Polyangiaceae bacterium]
MGCTSPTAAGCKLVIESESTSTATSQLTIAFKILNPSINIGSDITLSDVKVRYYFNTGTQPLGFSFTCDSASIDNPYVSIGSDVTA